MMLTWEVISSAMGMLLSWNVLLLLFVGMFIGVWAGAIPGISATLALTIMLIPSLYLQPIEAMVLLTAIFTGGLHAGSISAILLNIPGAPGAIVTGLDGYPMTKKGLHNEALGIDLISSAFGCFFGYCAIFFLMIPISRLVLLFGSSEMLALAIFTVTIIGVVKGSLIKAVVGATMGFLFGAVGASPSIGVMRGTFGLWEFYQGLDAVAVILGLLALKELFNMVEEEQIVDDSLVPRKKNLRIIVRSFLVVTKHKMVLLRSAVVGLVIGLLPATGATVGSLASYGMAQRLSKNPKTFGQGNPEGLIAAETANNASEGGSMCTMLAFGIPGGAASAVLMSALAIHGLPAGPHLLRRYADFTYALLIANLIQPFILIIVGILFIMLFSNVVYVKNRLLVPALFIIIFFGAYILRGNKYDLLIVILFGIIGILYSKFDYPLLAIVLGFILSPILERNLGRVIIQFEGAYLQILTRPIVAILLIMSLLGLAYPLFFYLKDRQNS